MCLDVELELCYFPSKSTLIELQSYLFKAHFEQSSFITSSIYLIWINQTQSPTFSQGFVPPVHAALVSLTGYIHMMEDKEVCALTLSIAAPDMIQTALQ